MASDVEKERVRRALQVEKAARRKMWEQQNFREAELERLREHQAAAMEQKLEQRRSEHQERERLLERQHREAAATLAQAAVTYVKKKAVERKMAEIRTQQEKRKSDVIHETAVRSSVIRAMRAARDDVPLEHASDTHARLTRVARHARRLDSSLAVVPLKHKHTSSRPGADLSGFGFARPATHHVDRGAVRRAQRRLSLASVITIGTKVNSAATLVVRLRSQRQKLASQEEQARTAEAQAKWGSAWTSVMLELTGRQDKTERPRVPLQYDALTRMCYERQDTLDRVEELRERLRGAQEQTWHRESHVATIDEEARSFLPSPSIHVRVQACEHHKEETFASPIGDKNKCSNNASAEFYVPPYLKSKVHRVEQELDGPRRRRSFEAPTASSTARARLRINVGANGDGDSPTSASGALPLLRAPSEHVRRTRTARPKGRRVTGSAHHRQRRRTLPVLSDNAPSYEVDLTRQFMDVHGEGGEGGVSNGEGGGSGGEEVVSGRAGGVGAHTPSSEGVGEEPTPVFRLPKGGVHALPCLRRRRGMRAIIGSRAPPPGQPPSGLSPRARQRLASSPLRQSTRCPH